MLNKQPSWFHGYNVAAVATVAYAASAPGQTFIVSQFNSQFRETFGISELTLNTSYTVATIAASLPLVLVGSLTDRLGPRRAMALIALLFGLGCLVIGGAPNFAMVCVGFFLVRFLGMGALHMVSGHAVAMWFHRRLGLVNGIKQVAVFGLWIAFPQIAILLIAGVGWRWTYGIFALLIWIAVIPAALLVIRNKPEDIGLCLDGDDPQLSNVGDPASAVHSDSKAALEPAFTLKQAMRTRAYWAIVAAIFPAPLIGTALLFDVQPILAQHGMDQSDAANVVSAWTASMAIMAMPSGWMTDRFRPAMLFLIGILVIACSVGMFAKASTVLMAMSAFAVYGVGQSIVASCANATLARYFGRSAHGAIRSSIVRIGVLATGLGPMVTALSVEFTGSYSAAMIVFMLLCVPALAMCIGLRPPPEPSPAG